MIYNGSERAPEREDLKLSEAFEVPTEGYEWTAYPLYVKKPGSKPGFSCAPVIQSLLFQPSSGSGSILSVKMDKTLDSPQMIPKSTTVMTTQNKYPNRSFAMISASVPYLSIKLSTTGNHTAPFRAA